jgi:hypothetical protein
VTVLTDDPESKTVAGEKRRRRNKITEKSSKTLSKEQNEIENLS